MIRVFIMFALVFGVFFFGIQGLRALSGKEAWELTKLLSYSVGCAILTVLLLTGIVIAF